MRSVLRLWIVCLLPCGFLPAAPIQTSAAKTVQTNSRNSSVQIPAYQESWTFDKSVSAWFPVAFDGRLTSDFGVMAKHLRLSDVVSGTRGGVLLHFSARKGRVGLCADFGYGNLERTNNVSYSPRQGTVDMPVTDSIHCGITDVMLFYRLGNAVVSFDTLGGFRFLQVRSYFSMDQGYIKCDKDFLEPLAGGMLHLGLSEHWNLSARLRFSGFGLGSELTTDAETHLSYKLTSRIRLFAGYRFFDTEYQQKAGGFLLPGVGQFSLPQPVYDRFHVEVACTIHGPIAGFSVCW